MLCDLYVRAVYKRFSLGCKALFQLSCMLVFSSILVRYIKFMIFLLFANIGTWTTSLEMKLRQGPLLKFVVGR